MLILNQRRRSLRFAIPRACHANSVCICGAQRWRANAHTHARAICGGEKRERMPRTEVRRNNTETEYKRANWWNVTASAVSRVDTRRDGSAVGSDDWARRDWSRSNNAFDTCIQISRRSNLGRINCLGSLNLRD